MGDYTIASMHETEEIIMHLAFRRWSLLAGLIMFGSILLSPSLPTAAAPVACSTFVLPFVAWAPSPASLAGNPYIQFELTSISKDGPVSYATDGALDYLPAGKFTPAILSTRAGFPTHDARQYFSDRSYA